MRYLSVCSGIEAASVAWHPLGWTPAGFSEIEPFPRAVLEQRHGAVAVDWDHRWTPGQNYPALFGDFTQIGPEHVGPVDLLVGGTPCQSFSIAGKRLGLDDPRGNLAIEFLALAKRIRARWLVWENVPGVYSSWSGEPDDETIGEWTETADFAEFLDLFRECGYRGAWRTIDAQFVRVDGFGRAVPQRRRRCFLVGHSGNDARAIPVLFDPESLRGSSCPGRTAGEGLAGALGSDPEGDRGTGPQSSLISGTVSSKWAKGSGGPSGDECQNLVAVPVQTVAGTICKDSFSGGMGGRPEGAAAGHIVVVPFDTTQITSAANGSNPKAGDPCHPLAAGAHPPCVAYAIQERAVSENPAAGPQGKGWQEGISFTLEARNNVQAVAYTDGVPAFGGWTVRKLTPRECERLQGFPDDFTAIQWRGKSAPDGPRYKAIGNSMAVNVMRWIGARIALVERAVEEAAGQGNS